MTKKQRIVIICSCVFLLLFSLYILLVNVLIDACLVPSFMEKLDAFEEITVKSYSEMVQTSDIKETRKTALTETQQWVRDTEKQTILHFSDDGYKMIAREFLRNDDSHLWVLMFHGYTGWKEEMYQYGMEFYKRGYHVIVPDLRCSGKSEGDYIGMGLTDSQDCMYYVDYIVKKDPEARIVLFGQSMGGACALMMSGRDDLPENIRAVVSDCAYADAYTMFEEKILDWFHLPAFPLVDSAVLMLRLRGGYNLREASSVDRVSKTKLPILLIHGDRDKMISVDNAYRIYEAVPTEKKLLIIEGAGHAQAADKNPESYYGTVFDFLKDRMN